MMAVHSAPMRTWPASLEALIVAENLKTLSMTE